MIDFEKPAGVLVKTTLVDFPGHVSCAFFLKGCNLRCPYCYNTGLVLPSAPSEDTPELVSVNTLFAHLEKRKNVLTGLTISGGEALINPALPEIIKKAKSLGYKIKLDTNAVNPERLEQILNNSELRPDFIAVDIKTSPDRYGKELTADKSAALNDILKEKVIKTIELVSAMPSSQREFRTVLVPHLVEIQDIKNIASILPADASWMLAQFRNENCLDPAYNKVSPYLDRQLNELLDCATELIKNAQIR